MKKIIILCLLFCVVILNINVHKGMTLVGFAYDNFNVIEYECCEDFEYLLLRGNIDEFISGLNIDIVKVFNVSDSLIIEGFTNKVSKYVVADGVKINIQIAIGDDCLIVGSPVIKKSF